MELQEKKFAKSSEVVKDIYNLLADTKLRFEIHRVFQDQYGTYVLVVYGGENGCGEWNNYFEQFSTFCDKVKGVWLIDLKNDCMDDCWMARFGLPFKTYIKKYTESKGE